MTEETTAEIDTERKSRRHYKEMWEAADAALTETLAELTELRSLYAKQNEEVRELTTLVGGSGYAKGFAAGVAKMGELLS